MVIIKCGNDNKAKISYRNPLVVLSFETLMSIQYNIIISHN